MRRLRFPCHFSEGRLHALYVVLDLEMELFSANGSRIPSTGAASLGCIGFRNVRNSRHMFVAETKDYCNSSANLV